MPHERDVLKPRAHMAHIRLIGSELLGLERDHSGVISAWFEHDQILAGTECIGVGSHRFDGHTGLTDFLANLVAGADLPGIDGLVAGQSDLDAIGAGEYGRGAAVSTAVGDVGPGVIEAAPSRVGCCADRRCRRPALRQWAADARQQSRECRNAARGGMARCRR